ncbi:hypothetical protein Acor_50160 [Acrocarpospora corrugata]|uniref:Uncharacterized protein n=1 Tax=Acrocarpospora corrugata TaxID=35763 RepID=A0A5M3W3Y1_9ACTN|nr:hypothetical protein Acor_50160 [Acrocarpospora corrugata]
MRGLTLSRSAGSAPDHWRWVCNKRQQSEQAQGGGFGSGISRALGLEAPGSVVAVHVNGGTTYPSVGADDLLRGRARVG